MREKFCYNRNSYSRQISPHSRKFLPFQPIETVDCAMSASKPSDNNLIDQFFKLTTESIMGKYELNPGFSVYNLMHFMNIDFQEIEPKNDKDFIAVVSSGGVYTKVRSPAPDEPKYRHLVVAACVVVEARQIIQSLEGSRYYPLLAKPLFRDPFEVDFRTPLRKAMEPLLKAATRLTLWPNQAKQYVNTHEFKSHYQKIDSLASYFNVGFETSQNFIKELD